MERDTPSAVTTRRGQGSQTAEASVRTHGVTGLPQVAVKVEPLSAGRQSDRVQRRPVWCDRVAHHEHNRACGKEIELVGERGVYTTFRIVPKNEDAEVRCVITFSPVS